MALADGAAGVKSLSDAYRQICTLKARYFRLMDQKKWAELADVFTEDAIFDVRGALSAPMPEEDLAKEPIIQGRDAILAYMSTGLVNVTSVHHGMMPEIEMLSDCEATGTWAMQDLLLFPSGGPLKRFRGFGHYHERYLRADGVWRIAALQLRRLHVESE